MVDDTSPPNTTLKALLEPAPSKSAVEGLVLKAGQLPKKTWGLAWFEALGYSQHPTS